MEFDQNIIDIIKNGGVGVLPTDTIFGVVASVFKPEAVARIYEVKKRPNDKKLIVLISNRGQLPSLGVNPKLGKTALRQPMPLQRTGGDGEFRVGLRLTRADHRLIQRGQ